MDSAEPVCRPVGSGCDRPNFRYTDGHRRAANRAPGVNSVVEPTVLQAKRFGILSCRPDESLGAVAWRMVDEYISALVVLAPDGSLAGVISRTDLLRARLDCADWPQEPVHAHMSTDVVTVHTNASLKETCRLMVTRHIHRVVVVDDAARPVAVISSADLVYHMTKLVPRPHS